MRVKLFSAQMFVNHQVHDRKTIAVIAPVDTRNHRNAHCLHELKY